MPTLRKGNHRINSSVSPSRAAARDRGAAVAMLVPLFIVGFIFSTVLMAASQTAVTTYHYDNYRTGWNQNESVLTPANVVKTTFGLLANSGPRRTG